MNKIAGIVYVAMSTAEDHATRPLINFMGWTTDPHDNLAGWISSLQEIQQDAGKWTAHLKEDFR